MPFADLTSSPLIQLVSLHGRGVVVTGAGQGLGKAIAARAAEAGASVLLVERDAARAESAATDLRRRGRPDAVHVAVADVCDSTAVDAVFERARELLPSLQGLVNNVGVFPRSDAVEMSDDEWHHVIQTDLTSAFWCARAFARAADPDLGGSIVMNGSIESVRGRPGLAHYTAAKFGMVGMAQTLAIELGARNIRVNTLAPGLVETESTSGSDVVRDPQRRARWGAVLPAGRMAVPDDVARAALFFLSDLSGYVTGTTLLVDGGERAG